MYHESRGGSREKLRAGLRERLTEGGSGKKAGAVDWFRKWNEVDDKGIGSGKKTLIKWSKCQYMKNVERICNLP